MYDGYLLLCMSLSLQDISLQARVIWKLHEGGLGGHFGQDKTAKIGLVSVDVA